MGCSAERNQKSSSTHETSGLPEPVTTDTNHKPSFAWRTSTLPNKTPAAAVCTNFHSCHIKTFKPLDYGDKKLQQRCSAHAENRGISKPCWRETRGKVWESAATRSFFKLQKTASLNVPLPIQG